MTDMTGVTKKLGAERPNGENYILVSRAARIFAFSLVFFAVGYLLSAFFPNGDVSRTTISHFCRFFEGADARSAVLRVLRFARWDMLALLFCGASGLVMLRRARLVFPALSALVFGVCIGKLKEALLASAVIDGGATAFALFAACKLIQLAALAMTAAEADIFYYEYAPYVTRVARRADAAARIRELALRTLSAVGFSVTVNVIYLAFTALQKYNSI